MMTAMETSRDKEHDKDIVMQLRPLQGGALGDASRPSSPPVLDIQYPTIIHGQ
jgi:hypothetical protein